MVILGLQLLFKDRQQFENAREVLSATSARYGHRAFVAAVGCPGDVKHEPHAISRSARAAPGVCCLQGAPMRPDVTYSLAWSASGISLGFPLGRDPWVWVGADKGGELMTAMDAEFCVGASKVILDGLRA